MAQLSHFERSSSFNSFEKKWTQNDILLDNIMQHSNLAPEAKSIVRDGVRVDQLLTIKYRLPHGSKIFGAHLSALVHDYRTCRLALIEPRLGVPIVLEKVCDTSVLCAYSQPTTTPRSTPLSLLTFLLALMLPVCGWVDVEFLRPACG